MRVADIVLFQLIKKGIQLDVFCICACLCQGVRQPAAYSQFREHKCYTAPPHATVALRCRDNKLRLSGFSFCDGPRLDQSRSCLTPPSPQVWTIITISFSFSQPSKLFLPFVNLSCVSFYERGKLG